jgi:4-amino-4-deoxy-L-arabinose transferase-like glycosyltransferase
MLRLRRIFALMALALVVAPLAANAPLFDPDEGLHAAIAQEMVLRGDYVTPTFLGEPFLDKPILFFWAEAASLRVLGDREAAVRLPPLLFGLLGMIGVAALGRAMFDEMAGLVAGIVYGTMLLPLGVSEVAVHDVAVVPFMCAACTLLVASAFGRKILGPALLAGVALGLSILTKGLVGVVFAGILGACLAVRTPKAIGRLAIFLAIAGAVAILVAVPWYIAMERAHPGYLYYYFVERHLQGYLTATQRHAGRGWWYYIPIVIGGTLPWTGYLVSAARSATAAWRAEAQSAEAARMRIVTWAWFLAGFVFLSAGESKLVTYVLPLFPALAILAGERIVSAGTFGGRIAYGVFAAVLAILPIGALAAVALKFGGVGAAYWTIVALVSAAIAVVAIRVRPRRGLAVEDAAAAILRLPVMALFGLMIVSPLAASWMTARDVAAALNTEDTLPSHVSVLDERIGSLVFYLTPPLRAAASHERIDEATIAEAVSRSRVEPADAVLAVRNDQVARFNRLFPVAPVPMSRAGTFTIFRAGALREALQGR